MSHLRGQGALCRVRGHTVVLPERRRLQDAAGGAQRAAIHLLAQRLGHVRVRSEVPVDV